MAGYGDMMSGDTGYSVPSGVMDRASGMSIELQRK